MRTEVAIIGAGPAGHLLAQRGVDSIIVETRSADYVASRISAGMLEHSTVDLLDSVGLGERLRRRAISTVAFVCSGRTSGTTLTSST